MIKYLLTASFACLSVLGAFTDTTNLGPIVQFESSSLLLDEDFAVSFLGEIGPRNYRANGTFGFEICGEHQFKFGGEILCQRLKYRFSAGEGTRQWMHQYALGGEYRYLFESGCFLSVDLGANISRAPSKWVRPVVFENGVIIERRIAGSHFSELFLGGTLEPWSCAALSVAATYDWVHYNTHYRGSNNKSGFGVTATFNQGLPYGLLFDITGELRAPFNTLRGALNWQHQLRSGRLGVGVFAAATDGKRHLPSSNAYGLQLAFDFGCWTQVQEGCESACLSVCPSLCLADWVRTPAVYDPQVLAIAESLVLLPVCNPPLGFPIPTLIGPLFGDYAFDLSRTFYNPGPPLTFSATGLPTGATIDPTTGIISGFNPGFDEFFTGTVTATSACGSVTSRFEIFLPGFV